MLVKDCMTRHPIMVTPETKATDAQAIMAENNIRHLPVVGDGKRLMGLVTRQRLRLKPDELASLNVWEITRALSELTVDRLMVKAVDVKTIDANKTVERAARTMSENKIGCLPVIEDGIVVGIITETDLLNAFQLMLGLPSEGVRVTIRMPDEQGIFMKCVSRVVEQGWPIMGIGTFPTRRQPGYYDLVLKIAGVDKNAALEVLSGIPDQEIVDIRTVV